MVALVKPHLRRHLFGFVTTLCVLVLTSAIDGWAQTANQAQLTREQAPSAFPSTVPPTGAEGGNVAAAPGDADLGEQQILKRVEDYQPFTISAGAPFYWTSNVALTRSGEQSDFVVAPAAAAFYEPRITSTLYGLIDVREQLFYYDRFDNFNFGSFDVEAGFRYLMPQWHNLLLRVEDRLQPADREKQLCSFLSKPRLHHRRVDSVSIWARSNAHSGRRFEYQHGSRGIWTAAKHQRDLSPAKRLCSLSWVFGGSHSFLFHQRRGSLVVRQYYEGGRDDVSEILALTANYRVNKYLTLSAVRHWRQANRTKAFLITKWPTLVAQWPSR